MAGHLGSEKVTAKSIEVVAVDDNQGIIMLRGSVPGFKGAYVKVSDAKKIFKENNNEKVSEAIEINRKESAEAIDFVFDIINSDMSLEDKISRIKAFFADTDAGGRKIALFAVMAKGELKTDLDHRPPINIVKKKIIEAIENPQKLSELRTFLESTRINNIPFCIWFRHYKFYVFSISRVFFMWYIFI